MKGYVPYNGNEIKQTLIAEHERFLNSASGLGLGNSYHAFVMEINYKFSAYPTSVALPNAENLIVELAGKKIDLDLIPIDADRKKLVDEILSEDEFQKLLTKTKTSVEGLDKLEQDIIAKADKIIEQINEIKNKLILTKSTEVTVDTSIPDLARKEYNLPIGNKVKVTA